MDKIPLPFARGETFYEGDTALIAAGGDELVGARFTDFDPVTGKEVELICLKATAGLTAPAGIGQTLATGYIDRVSGPVASAGIFGWIADPSLVGDVVSGDLFWGIYAGNVGGVKVDTTNLTLGGAVKFHSNGMLTPVTGADAVVIGMSDAAVTAGAAGAVTASITVPPPGAGAFDLA